MIIGKFEYHGIFLLLFCLRTFENYSIILWTAVQLRPIFWCHFVAGSVRFISPRIQPPQHPCTFFPTLPLPHHIPTAYWNYDQSFIIHSVPVQKMSASILTQPSVTEVIPWILELVFVIYLCKAVMVVELAIGVDGPTDVQVMPSTYPQIHYSFLAMQISQPHHQFLKQRTNPRIFLESDM